MQSQGCMLDSLTTEYFPQPNKCRACTTMAETWATCMLLWSCLPEILASSHSWEAPVTRNFFLLLNTSGTRDLFIAFSFKKKSRVKDRNKFQTTKPMTLDNMTLEEDISSDAGWHSRWPNDGRNSIYGHPKHKLYGMGLVWKILCLNLKEWLGISPPNMNFFDEFLLSDG